MNGSIRVVRAAYWTGAIIDAFFAVALLSPRLWGMSLGLDPFAPDIQHRLDMGIGAALMLSWTALLVWADRRPVERRGVLLLTVFPALTCLAATGIAAVLIGASTLLRMLPVFVMQAALAMLFLGGYRQAHRAAVSSGQIR